VNTLCLSASAGAAENACDPHAARFHEEWFKLQFYVLGEF
jgi:hypothetical protein